MTNATARLGGRLRALRDQRGLSQEDLSRTLGFKDRQTLSAIETGERRLSADELLRAVKALGVSVEQFIDPFQLAGEGRFSWRQSGVPLEGLNRFESQAGRWIAAFREIAPQVGRQRPLLRPSLGLDKGSTVEEAMAAGERFAREFGLGAVPAARLQAVMEDRLHILVLMVDALAGISGAACHLPELDAVLINRREAESRRHFDLAHELFHVLTWQAMPPEHVEAPDEDAGKGRVEQLANAFASALLMPKELLGTLDPLPSPNEIKAIAVRLRVSGVAVKWRLVSLGVLSRKAALVIDDRTLRGNGKGSRPPLFSKPFLEVLGEAIDQGQVSARRAAELAGLTLDDLATLFEAHGVTSPFDL